MKITSLKAKVKRKHSVSQFHLEGCNKQKNYEQKTHLSESEREEEQGLGPGRTGWNLHGRWVMPASRLAQTLPPQPCWCRRNSSLGRAHCPALGRQHCARHRLLSRKPTHFCTHQNYIYPQSVQKFLLLYLLLSLCNLMKWSVSQ